MARRRGGRRSRSPRHQAQPLQSHRRNEQVSAGSLGELVRGMNESMKKCSEERQKLWENHRSRVQKLETDILNLIHARRSHFIKCRAAQIKGIFDLVKKRSEIENHILSRVQGLDGIYCSVSNGLQGLFEARLSKLS
ncbi:hypothetical protein VTN02DRAFT_2880 [Thermoascus thermophilus]